MSEVVHLHETLSFEQTKGEFDHKQKVVWGMLKKFRLPTYHKVVNVTSWVCNFEQTVSSYAVKASNKVEGWPAVTYHKYWPRAMEKRLKECEEELLALKPRFIIAFGPTAMWFLKKTEIKISIDRGFVFDWKGIPCLGTYNPTQVYNVPHYYPVMIKDLLTAYECITKGVNHTPVTAHIPETIQDIEDFYNKYLKGKPVLSADIETEPSNNGIITCVGFAGDENNSISIPLRANGKHYWFHEHEEQEAMKWIKYLLETYPIVGQNFNYDIVNLVRCYGILPNAVGDTMFQHHALQPEFPKSLGFLASLHTRYPEWKSMNRTEESE